MPVRSFLPAIFLLCLILPSARGVVVAQDNSTIYTQPPVVDDFGFASVGVVSNFIAGIPASGVYLGDGWMLTAYHNVANGSGGFGFGGVFLGGVSYGVEPSTGTRLHNPDSSLADLAMFRLTEIPQNVPAVNLADVAPNVGVSVRMMGNGQDRALTETNWLVVANSWTEVAVGGNRSGYELVGTRAMRWGNNAVDSTAGLIDDNGTPLPFGNFIGFRMDFDDVSGEAMATGGDSGGGVFAKNGTTWELAGIMLLTDRFNGQPDGTVVYGNSTYAANIATYKTEIVDTMATVPEPSTAALLLIGSISLFRRRHPVRDYAS